MNQSKQLSLSNLSEDEKNARAAAAVTQYGQGTRSYNRSAEKREMDRQREETTAKYHRMWETADAMFFYEGRVNFVRSNLAEGDPAPAPSVLIAFGKENAAQLEAVKWKGSLVTKWRRK